MSVRMPPLNALRAFEAAARHASFAKAADELAVTPAAISHQVKQLEAFLGTELFKRLPRGLLLTDSGRQSLPELTKGFAHLARAAQAAVSADLTGQLTISTIPSFATLWMLPRLPRFFQAYPEIEVRVFGDIRAVDFTRDDVDIAVRSALRQPTNVYSRLLMHEDVFPVCAPSLLNRAPLRRLQDLAHFTLIHDVHIGTAELALSWSNWFTGLPSLPLDPGRGLKFSDSIMTIEAAVMGLGVALGRTSIVGDHLAAGRLVRPLAISRRNEHALFTVVPEAAAHLPKVRAFTTWLEQEVAADQRAGLSDCDGRA